MSWDKRRLVLQLWAMKLGIPLPRELILKHDLVQPKNYTSPTHDCYELAPLPADMKVIARSWKILGNLVTTLLEKNSFTPAVTPAPNYNDGLMKELLEMNQRLQQEIIKLREEVYRKDLEYPSKQLEELKKNAGNANEYVVLLKALDNLEKKTTKLIKFLQALAVAPVKRVPDDIGTLPLCLKRILLPCPRTAWPRGGGE